MNQAELMALFERAAILVLQGKCQPVSSALVGAIKYIYDERRFADWRQAMKMTESIYGSATTQGFHYLGGYNSGKCWLSAEDKQTLVLMLCFMYSIVESGYIA